MSSKRINKISAIKTAKDHQYSRAAAGNRQNMAFGWWSPFMDWLW